MAYLVDADDVAIAEQDRQAVRRGEVFVAVDASVLKLRVVGGGPGVDTRASHTMPSIGMLSSYFGGLLALACLSDVARGQHRGSAGGAGPS